ncbi:MAG: FtsK/SpoIIIE domain-containing protein [Pseudonocardiaceae bacterium]
MQIVIETAGVVRDVDVNIQVPDATVGDLLEALGYQAGDGVAGIVVDGRFLQAYLALTETGLHDGTVVRLGADRERASTVPVSGPVLAVVGGVDAGRRIVLRPGRTLIGRDDGCDVTLSSPAVSSRHCILEVDRLGEVVVEDLGSKNGTWMGGEMVRDRRKVSPGDILLAGAVHLTLVERERNDRPALLGAQQTAGGNIAFNRPPRPMPTADTSAVALPKPTRESASRQPFSWISMLAPLALAAVMVKVGGSAMYALFALLSPIMLVGNWVEGRRRGKQTSRQESARFAADLEAFCSQLEQRRIQATVRTREELPDPSEVLRRATAPSVRLWERRLDDPDVLRLSAGLGAIGWQAPVANTHGERPTEVAQALAEASWLELAPVLVDLSDGGVVGIAGERSAALALARSLMCQAVVHHGPADLRVAVLTEPEEIAVWEWTKWLPHTRDAAAGGGARTLAGPAEQSNALLGDLLEAGRAHQDRRSDAGRERRAGPVLLTVVDAVGLTEGKNAPARAVLRGAAGPVAGIVLAPTPDRLPAVCTTVVELLDAEGTATLTRPRLGEVVEGLIVAGVSVETARSCALALACFEDPETATAGASLPSRVDVATLFTEDVFDSGAVAGLWQTGGQDPGIAAPIGVTEEGVLTLDLLRDGPHGLVGGTTGSGKSELLRSLVAALALRTDPEHLNFVLIDYKGGSAFDECARLPHTVGLVTDLDAQLGERALRCLEAELHYRERLLRASGADDLRAYLRLPAATETPLPRLVVIIDEFATMAAELPDFMEALVGVAQRGRSLGVHLLLATQRPSGAVKDNIRANTNLRIALRVQDDGDSTDVIGKPDAARIGRDQPGRAFVRLGPSEVVPIQTALVTGTSQSNGGRVDVAPFQFGRRPRPPRPAATSGEATASDLERIVAAARAAFEAAGMPTPRRPWPEPLPADLPLDTVTAPETVKAGTALVALADDPDAQAQYPVGWNLGKGNLLLFGLVGSGTTTTLASIALSLAAGVSPDELHLYVLDFGAGALSPLEGLPHTGAVITATEGERQRRLVRMLRGELDRRRELGAASRDEPLAVLLVDGFSALRAEYDDPAVQWVQDELARIVSEGSPLGILTVITVDRTGAVPTALSSTVSQKWLFRLSDPYDYAMYGVKFRSPSALPPGRCLVADNGQLIQVGRPTPSLTEAVDRISVAAPVPLRPPMEVGTLPVSVDPHELTDAVRLDDEPWLLPVGIAESTHTPAALRIYPAEHVLIAGPSRSGRSGLLCALARLLTAATPKVGLTVVAARPSPLRQLDGVDRVVTNAQMLPEALAQVAEVGGRQVVLIDNAEALDDPAGAVDALLKRLLPDVHVIAAGRADLLRSAYGHWTQTVRRSGTGVLLRPDADFDGDLLAVRLPRRTPVAVTVARGWLVNGGEAEFIQAATVR